MKRAVKAEVKEQWNDDVHYCQGERAVSRSLRKTALALATASKRNLFFVLFFLVLFSMGRGMVVFHLRFGCLFPRL
ncbi:hypothetical protein B1A75_05270 [Geobacillus sp. LEMMY01]|nr:hypothetical protein B1A75_05270 [Geobacillus sp. LEMMY01]